MVLDEIPAIDLAALAWLLAVWAGYRLVMDRLLRGRVGLNQYMKDVRTGWMVQMLGRENRIADASLGGNLMHGVSFFASTTMLVLLRRQLPSRTFRAIRGHLEPGGPLGL